MTHLIFLLNFCSVTIMRLDLHFTGTELFVNLVPRVGEIRRSDFTA
jgi:hypothetical protein